jgi:hypothetical protein
MKKIIQTIEIVWEVEDDFDLNQPVGFDINTAKMTVYDNDLKPIYKKAEYIGHTTVIVEEGEVNLL